MQWLAKYSGQSRVITRFAILPIRAGIEWRWFELVKIRQIWRGSWVNDEFLDRPK